MKDDPYHDLTVALNVIRDKYDLRHSELVALLAHRLAAMTETSKPAR
jgi:hypothetical protein